MLFGLITYMTLMLTPGNFMDYKSQYDDVMKDLWPDLHPKYILAAQIEHESLWNPKAELKTKREYGFGFGQLTIAYKPDGVTERFNKFNEAKSKYSELKGWLWKDRYNPKMQIIFVVKENRLLFEKFKGQSGDHITNLALMQSAYNGGSTLLLREIAMCSADAKCNAKIWFCNINKKAARSTVKQPGYGKSFHDINRDYITNVMFTRYPKYMRYENNE